MFPTVESSRFCVLEWNMKADGFSTVYREAIGLKTFDRGLTAMNVESGARPWMMKTRSSLFLTISPSYFLAIVLFIEQ